MEEEFVIRNYLESLIKCRPHLEGSSLLKKLDEIIKIELELALLGSKKALVEVNGTSDNIKRIK